MQGRLWLPREGSASCTVGIQLRGGVGHPALPPFSTLPSTGLQPRSQEDVALGLVARIPHGPA